jgi:hypothetical protein
MDTYIDLLMKNHKLVSDSSDEMPKTYNSILITQKGGNPDNESDKLKHVATGSFPPIYIMTAEEKQKEEELEKTRGYTSKNTAVSIKEIMQERREDKKPFAIL